MYDIYKYYIIKKLSLEIASSKAAVFNIKICFSGSHRACEQRDHEGEF
jgi:hypothetical protein